MTSNLEAGMYNYNLNKVCPVFIDIFIVKLVSLKNVKYFAYTLTLRMYEVCSKSFSYKMLNTSHIF